MYVTIQSRYVYYWQKSGWELFPRRLQTHLVSLLQDVQKILHDSKVNKIFKAVNVIDNIMINELLLEPTCTVSYSFSSVC